MPPAAPRPARRVTKRLPGCRRSPAAALLTAALLMACGDDGGGPAPPDGPTELTGEKFSVTWGPVLVQPGVENTQCAVLELGNDAPLKIHRMRNLLGNASHHLIVYRDDDAAPQPTPVDCSPFAGTLTATSATSPIMITQRHDETLTLPDQVAYTFQPRQRLRLELHYLNATDRPQMVTASAEFYPAVPEQIEHEADFLFIGTPDITLPPNSSTTVNSYFTPPFSVSFEGARFFAITGHTHQYGTGVEVAVAPGRGLPGTSVYAPRTFVWSEPETVMQDPPFELPTGSGFSFRCTYRNTSTRTVRFGESTGNEMCFFWAYYYPARGAHLCAHSDQAGGANGLDVCCPAADTDLTSKFVCNLIAQQL